MSSFYDKFTQYTLGLVKAYESLDLKKIEKFAEAIQRVTEAGGTIYVAGNGGSAAISEHLACDVMKGVGLERIFKPRVVSLASNLPLLTAIANDLSYEDVFSFQLKHLINELDTWNHMFIAISSSGNSENIIQALDVANDFMLTTVALTGFSGGRAADMASINIHVDADNYGVIEDVHQSVMHMVAQYLRDKNLAS